MEGLDGIRYLRVDICSDGIIEASERTDWVKVERLQGL